jgi:hypothetical protein
VLAEAAVAGPRTRWSGRDGGGRNEGVDETIAETVAETPLQCSTYFISNSPGVSAVDRGW